MTMNSTGMKAQGMNIGTVWRNIDASELDRIWNKTLKTFDQHFFSDSDVTLEVYKPYLDRGHEVEITNVTWNTGSNWKDLDGVVREIDPSIHEVRTYVYTDTWYHQETTDINSDGTWSAQIYSTDSQSNTNYSARVYRKANDCVVDVDGSEIDKSDIVNAKVTDIDYSVYTGQELLHTDSFYPQGTLTIDTSDGHFGFFNTSSGTLVLRVVEESNTDNFVGEWYENKQLIKSYDIPRDETQDGANMYDVLGERCFIYGQAIAVCAAVAMGKSEKAKQWVDGLLNTQYASGRWAFSYNSLDSQAVDDYFRTGSEFWAVYALIFALQKLNFDSTKQSTIETAVQDFFTDVESNLWVDDGTLQRKTFSGGKGKYLDSGNSDNVTTTDGSTTFAGGDDYSIDYVNGTITLKSGGSMSTGTTYNIDYEYYNPHPDKTTVTDEQFSASSYGTAVSLNNSDIVDAFDEKHTIPWTGTEHTIDAYHAYSAAYDYFGDSAYQTKRDELADSLFNRLWRENEGQAARGVEGDSLDTCHALDTGSWYSITALADGKTEIQKEAISSTDKYIVEDKEGGATLRGFKPYHVDHCYPEAKDVVWFEGTWGCCLAYLAAGNVPRAAYFFREALKLENDRGWPYTTQEQKPYQMQDWNSLASTAWAILAMKPNGFLGITDSVVE